MSLESRNKKLLRETSRRWNLVLVGFLSGVFLLGLAVRFYAIEPIRLLDNSLEPQIQPGNIVWLCKLPFCKNKLNRGDIVLADFPGKGPALRAVFGLPGDSVHVFSDGKIQTGSTVHVWEDESEMIAPRGFRIPRKNDSIFISELNDISFDYASRFLHRDGSHRYYVQAKLFRGNDTLPISRVGSAHLFGRPVGIREIHGLHWQEYFLIALQIDREDPGAKAVHFERRLFDSRDSSELAAFRFPENSYYLICLKGNRCEDSRTEGYTPQSRILGKALGFGELQKNWMRH